MPKLWTATIDAHRRAVRDATLDATAALVAAHGLSSVTMSQIAREAGIGRATLYKYFSDVDAIVVAWHERQVERHLEHLTKALGHGGSAGERLKAVLESYALNAHRHQDSELAARLHWGGHVARAHQHLREFIRELLVEGAEAGSVRRDVAPEELAGYCLHALTAAGDLPSEAAVRRLVGVVVDGCARRAEIGTDSGSGGQPLIRAADARQLSGGTGAAAGSWRPRSRWRTPSQRPR